MSRGVTSKKLEVSPKLAEPSQRFWWLLVAALSIALVLVIYRLYFSGTSYAKIDELQERLAEQQALNAAIIETNRKLMIEIDALKSGDFEIETRAREDLGLVMPGEEFYLFVESDTVDDG